MIQYRELLGKEVKTLVLNILKELGGVGTVSQISKRIGKKEKTVGDYLSRLQKAGKIIKTGKRTFRLS